jgi:membrane protein YdbS with pleckstrin-like domain
MLIIVVALGAILIRIAGAPPAWIIGIGAVSVLATATSIWPIPSLQWRFWRYEIGEQEVDLQRGWLVVTRTLIPMAQIQHVDTRRGPLERRFGLASVVLHTAAGASEIPALDDEVAGEVRDRIAGLANLNQQL